jgi:crotonobetainyl-CoA:carnitine CoA-transferase CaiB-like acyl-CoA transferase
LTAEEVIARLEAAQIANAHMNAVGDMWAHPQLQARGRYQRVSSPVGDLTAMLPPGVNDSFDYRMDAIPAVGEHTEAILRALGRDEGAIAALREAGAV